MEPNPQVQPELAPTPRLGVFNSALTGALRIGGALQKASQTAGNFFNPQPKPQMDMAPNMDTAQGPVYGPSQPKLGVFKQPVAFSGTGRENASPHTENIGTSLLGKAAAFSGGLMDKYFQSAKDWSDKKNAALEGVTDQKERFRIAFEHDKGHLMQMAMGAASEPEAIGQGLSKELGVIKEGQAIKEVTKPVPAAVPEFQGPEDLSTKTIEKLKEDYHVKSFQEVPLSDAIDIYRRNSDYNLLSEVVKAHPEEATKLREQTINYLNSRGIKKLYRGGEPDGFSYSTSKSVAESFAKRHGTEVTEVDVTPELEKRIIAAQGLVGNPDINATEAEIIISPVKIRLK